MIKRISKLAKKNYFLSASLIYISTSFLLRGISFITTPIFTRLMSPSELGTYSVFATWVTFFAVFIGGQVSGSIGVARVNMEPNRLKEYMQNITLLSIICAVVISLFTIINGERIVAILQIDISLLPHLLIQSFGAALTTLISIYFIQTKKPKLKMIFTIVVTLSLVLVGVILVNLTAENKDISRIQGDTFIRVLILLFVLYFFLRSFKLKNVNFSDWIFSLKFSSPLIIHLLANIIIGQASKLVVNDLLGSEAAGIYSIAHSIGILGMLFAEACNQAWGPWYFDRTKTGEINLVNKFGRIYIIIVSIVFCYVMFLSPEIMKLMAPEEYWSGTTLITIITLSVFFQFLYRFPVAYEQFSKSTKWIAICTIIVSIVNILLNYSLIPILGLEGAAISTLIAYILLFVLHEIVARIIVKNYNIQFKTYLPGLILCIPLGLLVYLIIDFTLIRYLIMFILSMLTLYWGFIIKGGLKNFKKNKIM